MNLGLSDAERRVIRRIIIRWVLNENFSSCNAVPWRRQNLGRLKPILNSVMTRCTMSERALPNDPLALVQVQGECQGGVYKLFVIYGGGGVKQLRSLDFTIWRWGIEIVSVVSICRG